MAEEVRSMSWIEELGKVYRKGRNSWFLEVHLKELDAVWPRLKEKVGRISSITANDTGKGMEVIYHFVDRQDIINIKTRLSSKKPQVKSITGHFPGAELIERELWETMGVEPVGHPNLKNIILDKKLSPKTPGLKEGNK